MPAFDAWREFCTLSLKESALDLRTGERPDIVVKRFVGNVVRRAMNQATRDGMRPESEEAALSAVRILARQEQTTGSTDEIIAEIRRRSVCSG